MLKDEVVKSSVEGVYADEELTRSETKYRSLVEDTAAGIITVDSKGTFTFVNETICEMMGYSEKELLGKFFADFIHPDDKKRVLQIFQRFLKAPKGKLSFEFKVIHKRGHVVHLHATPTLFTYNNEVVGSHAIITDITEHKKAEEKIRESEERYRVLVESAADAIFTLNEDGDFLSANETAAKTLEKTSEGIIGKNMYTLFPKDIADLQMRNLKTVFQTGKPIVGDETPTQTKFELRWYSTTLVPVRDSYGKILYAMGIARDITERKSAEMALRESEEKYRELINGMNDTAWVIGFDGKFIDVNDTAVKVLGYSREELLSMGPPDIDNTLTEEQIRDLIKQMPTDEIQVFETTHTTKTGKKIPVEISSNLVTYQGKQAILSIARDITERKKAEERIRASEEKYRSIVELAPDGIATMNMKGVITSINTAFSTLTGYSKEEIIGKHFAKLGTLRARDIPKYAKLVGSIFRGKIPSHIDFVYLRKDGTQRWGEARIGLLEEGGKKIGTQAILRDITERKKMVEVLERQRDIAITLSGAGDLIEAVKRLFDNLLKIEEFDCAGFYLVDKDTGALDMIVHRSLPDGFVEKVGHLDAESPYAKVVMEGKPIFQKTSDFPPVIREDLQSDGILAATSIPIHYKREVIGCLNMASHTHDEISATTRYILESVGAQIGENIVRAQMEEKLKQYSEHLEELVQKRTEELLESEKRYSVLVEEASDGVIIAQDEKLVFANKKFTEIVEYSIDELIGLPFEKTLDEKYRQLVKEIYARRLRGEEVPSTYEIEMLTKTGERVPVEVSAKRIFYQRRLGSLVTIRDIRERKRMEEQHLKLERLAAIGEAATMVGHDLRNPLQSIENATYYLNNELPCLPIPKKTTEMLQIINNSVNYADRIIRDLQDFATTKKPILKKTDINTLVKETLSQAEAPENIKLITELNRLPEIKTDKDMLKRAFLNLTINGIQAMENGGTLKVSTKKTKEFIEISFKDTGIGISKENMKKLFTPFFTTKAKGMGIGLPICKRFVENHSGSIEVESREGKGSTFTVKLSIRQNNGGEN